MSQEVLLSEIFFSVLTNLHAFVSDMATSGSFNNNDSNIIITGAYSVSELLQQTKGEYYLRRLLHQMRY